jgi:predicted DNA-binding antitoxin AbrB/MazE fold protein
MTQAVRAIYEQGRLRLLDPVNLVEGQPVELMILSERERARIALGDLLVKYAPEPQDDIDEEALLAEIDAATRGNPAVSDAILDERREGP